jgi:hypothetical protein
MDDASASSLHYCPSNLSNRRWIPLCRAALDICSALMAENVEDYMEFTSVQLDMNLTASLQCQTS